MDIAGLSIVMSQTKVQQSASISVMKLAMNTVKENALQMEEMLKNVSVDPDRGQNIDIRV